MTLCVLLYLHIVMQINHLCLELMNQCCLFLYSLLCYYVLYFIMLYGRFLICYDVMFLSYVVWALSDLLLCHVFVLRCTGHQIWLVLAMDIFVLCFLATIVFTSIHVVGLENYMVKMESFVFFLYGFVFNIMECRGKLFDLIIGILLRNVF